MLSPYRENVPKLKIFAIGLDKRGLHFRTGFPPLLMQILFIKIFFKHFYSNIDNHTYQYDLNIGNRNNQ